MPYIIKTLGVERFGLLTLIWAVIGYSTLLDMGLGRALTQHVATKIGENDFDNLPGVIITTIGLSTLGGCVGTLILWFATPWLVKTLNVSPPLVNETITAFHIMAISVPFLIGNIITSGVFEAFQRFGFINLLNWPIVFANFVAPFLILPFYPTLPGLVIAVLLSRIFVFIILLFNLPSVTKKFYSNVKFLPKAVIPLFHYGKWPCLNSVINGFMMQADRLFAASILGAGVVAFLTTPSFAITRFGTFVASATKVVFPAFGTEFIQNIKRCRRLYLKSITAMAVGLLFPYLVVFIFSELLLTLWLGNDFAKQAYIVTSGLAIAGYFNGINQTTHSFIDAVGRSKLSTMINIFILVPYLLSLYFSIQWLGILGASIGLCIKELLEMVCKLYAVERIFNQAQKKLPVTA
ncbi:MAG: oligosaccharide flippase family protein [Cyanobacteria bacterium P01_H01_bin.74]